MALRYPQCRGRQSRPSVKPGTLLEPYLEILRDFDTLLVMSVEPGFGGQELHPRGARQGGQGTQTRRLGEPRSLIEIDGGINADTIEQAAEAGVDCFVAGSAVYGAGTLRPPLEALRRQAGSASPHLRVTALAQIAGAMRLAVEHRRPSRAPPTRIRHRGSGHPGCLR